MRHFGVVTAAIRSSVPRNLSVARSAAARRWGCSSPWPGRGPRRGSRPAQPAPGGGRSNRHAAPATALRAHGSSPCRNNPRCRSSRCSNRGALQQPYVWPAQPDMPPGQQVRGRPQYAAASAAAVHSPPQQQYIRRRNSPPPQQPQYAAAQQPYPPPSNSPWQGSNPVDGRASLRMPPSLTHSPCSPACRPRPGQPAQPGVQHGPA